MICHSPSTTFTYYIVTDNAVKVDEGVTHAHTELEQATDQKLDYFMEWLSYTNIETAAVERNVTFWS